MATKWNRIDLQEALLIRRLATSERDERRALEPAAAHWHRENGLGLDAGSSSDPGAPTDAGGRATGSEGQQESGRLLTPPQSWRVRARATVTKRPRHRRRVSRFDVDGPLRRQARQALG